MNKFLQVREIVLLVNKGGKNVFVAVPFSGLFHIQWWFPEYFWIENKIILLVKILNLHEFPKSEEKKLNFHKKRNFNKK